jgi:uroporphyrin-III C-methyltransferase
MSGKVYLVGAGPGSADLLTVRAARLIEQADVILHDALVCQEVLDLAPQARKILVGKRAGQVSTDQGFINRLLVASAKDGSIVVRLKGGDPMVFGRAHEEILACQKAGLDIEIVPGITTAVAAAAQIGTSLTRRGVSRSLAFVTPTIAKGSQNDTSWADVAVASQTCAIYMGAGQADSVRDTLMTRGLRADLPVVLVHDVGRPNAGHIAGHLNELPALAQNLGTGPAILLIGDVFADLSSHAAIDQLNSVRHA